MAQYRDLNAPPKRALADIVAELRDQARSSKTGAHGVKDLGEAGDTTWTTPEGEVKSVRRFAVQLDDTAARAEQLEEDLRSARDALGVARARLLALSERPLQPDHELPDPPTAASGVGAAVGDVGVVRDAAGEPVSWWQWDGTAWRQVEFLDTLVARIAQIMELSVGSLIVTEGATIDQLVALAIAGATAEFQTAFIQNLRSNGAVMDEAVIGDLAANIITSGLFRTAAEGQRLEIDSNGLIMWGTDSDGNDYEMVRIGPSGDNLLTVGSSTISETGVSAPRGEFEQLTVAGQDLTGMIGAGPRGLVARARSTSVGEWDGSGNEVWRLQVNFYAYPDRMYRIIVPSHYVQTRSTIPNIITEFLRWKDITDGVGVNASSPQLDSIIHSIPRAGNYTVPGMTAVLDGSDIGSNPDGTRTQVVLSSRSPAGLDNRYVAGGAYPLAVIIEDIGPSLPWTGRSWVHVGTPSQGSSGGAAPETDRQERYTKTWSPQGYGGDVSGGDVVQGTYGSYGNRSGSWTMPGDMRTALQGSTIEKLEIYLYATHWYYGSGGTASIRATDGSTFKAFVGSAFTSANWPRSAGRWVTVPSSWHSYFQSGAWKGIGVQTGSTNLLYYGRFKADATRFRAAYRK